VAAPVPLNDLASSDKRQSWIEARAEMNQKMAEEASLEDERAQLLRGSLLS
jgi:hypothetical protein